MLKRTKGLLLLTLLVATGLAGALNTTSLSEKERKFAVNYFKETKADLQQSVKGLSEAQLNYKASEDRWSIKECFYHITMAEKNLWGMFEATMKLPATPEKRVEVKMADDDIMKLIANRSQKAVALESIQPVKASWNSLDEAMTSFKAERGDILKYTKTTTEDLRNHIFPMPFGSIDGYQLILFIAGHSNRHTQQINEVKADPNFPKQ